MHRSILILVLGAFSVLSAIAVWQHGYIGLFTWQLANTAGMQVLADLCIALSLVLTWLWRDARQTGRNPWPWVAFTMAAGSFGPLLYRLLTPNEQLVHHGRSSPEAANQRRGRAA